MARFWCTCPLTRGRFGVVIVDAPDRAGAIRASRTAVGVTDDAPLAIEMPPSEARRFDGALGRVLDATELSVRDPGTVNLRVTTDDIRTLEQIGRAESARERAAS